MCTNWSLIFELIIEDLNIYRGVFLNEINSMEELVGTGSGLEKII